MIGLVQPDRWTCPTCYATVLPKVRDEDELHDAIRRLQLLHSRLHAATSVAQYVTAVRDEVGARP